ncbi:DUF1499 domain-containing protein [Wenxinia marina]|uniref:DUF1499 domain-containing protein n=1 Tax=Wenxinia marina DSM 24838 TaxID=1123501 RepID=A0A0D0NHQ5_9RHOB|nr:DUF1499 domain-containing protein [Wenxinia marina]KIQ67880.1 hypothetical protein Wenmar_03610 [Wenxinia marina DSM 24838]GGL74370.1 hypothetical protein GCM10011392_31170 [Wenxinia marina]
MIGWFALPVAVLAGLGGWVRLAPEDAARFHVAGPPRPVGDYPAEGGFEVRRPAPPDALARLARVAEAEPRTHRAAGSPKEGMVTWISRSRLWGFPDYTTAWIDEAGNLAVHGRLRFGKGDMGVNRERVTRWLDAAGLA